MEAKISCPELKEEISVYYLYKKITPNQSDFITQIAKQILSTDKPAHIFEFPPTLDKDFLYCSTLYSLIHYGYTKNKFIILANSYEKVQLLTNVFSKIADYYITKKKTNSNVTVIPYIERKYTCFNYDKLQNSSTFDIDGYCLELNSSWVDEEKHCPYYKSCNKDIKISGNFDIEDQLTLLEANSSCAFYYYMNLIQNNKYDIVISQVKDFYDIRTRISLQKLTQYEENKDKITLIFDESNIINEALTRNFSSLIDEDLVYYSRIELFKLKEKIKSYSILNCDMYIDQTDEAKPEKEVFKYSLLCKDTRNFPGTIRKSAHFINLLSRLLVFFSGQFVVKKEETYSVYYFHQSFLRELWLEFRTLRSVLSRLFFQFNEIKFVSYQEMYNLIHFASFLTHLGTISGEGFFINYASYQYMNSNKFFFEIVLMEPNKFLTKENTLYFSGGIGNVDLFSKILGIQGLSYSDDDDIKSNVFLTNTSNTTQSNPTFYGEILKKIIDLIPDGTLCYFSSRTLMEDYIRKWNEQGVFDYILNNKLLFIEENDSERLSEIIVNYKKSVEIGRGGLLLLTLRNKASVYDEMYNEYSRGIIFIGLPAETKITKRNEFKLQYHIKYYDISDVDYLNYEAMSLMYSKIVNKIENRNDKKIVVILEEKCLSDKVKDYIPKWIRDLAFKESEEDSNNVHDRIKMITSFINEKDIKI